MTNMDSNDKSQMNWMFFDILLMLNLNVQQLKYIQQLALKSLCICKLIVIKKKKIDKVI